MKEEDKFQLHLDNPQAVVIGENNVIHNYFGNSKADDQRHAVVSPVWLVPYRQNPFFTGRDNLLKHIHDNLSKRKTAALTQPQAIHGLGGIGKTQCALEYAYRYREQYRYVLWTNAATSETLTSDFVRIASLLKLPEQNEQEIHKVVEAVKQWLTDQEGWLIILDNADDLNLVVSFLPTTDTGHILLTTREQAVGGLAQAIDVQEMDLEEGILMLLRRAKFIPSDASLEQASQQMREQAKSIVLEMGGLPLAIDQAGAYIEEQQCTLKEYQEEYKSNEAALLRERGRYGSGHADPVATTWFLSFQQVEQNSPLAADLMRCCAFLAPDAIPEELFLESASKLGPSIRPLAKTPTLLRKAVAELLRFSLMRRNPNDATLSMHRLVQVVIRNTLPKNKQKQWAERIIHAVNDAFPMVEPVTWSRCQHYLPHALAGAEQIKQWKIHTLEATQLLDKTASYLHDRAQYAEAEPLYQRALTIREQVLGKDHSDTAEILNNLALLYYVQGKYELAEPLYKRALTTHEQLMGKDHPKTASTLNNLAILYRKQGKYELAEPLFQRALTTREQALGKDHPETAASLDNLAGLYLKQGKYELAEPLRQRALAIYEQVLYPNHPDIATSLSNLGVLYRNQGKYELAEPLFQRALAIYEQVDKDHPSTATILSNLAELYRKQGKYELAELLFQRALTIREQVLGKDHPDTATTLNNLAELYHEPETGKDHLNTTTI